jgi:hypothetical protein
MHWTEPKFIDIDMNAEIGGYAPDDKPRSDDVGDDPHESDWRAAVPTS